MNRYIFEKAGLIIGSILIFIVIIWAFSSVMKSCSIVADEVQKQGLKNVIERIWEGERKQNSG